MTARAFKFPIILMLSFFSFRLLRRLLGIEYPGWFSTLSVIVVVGLMITFAIYGRKRQRLSNEYRAKQDSAPKFEDEVYRSSIDGSKDIT